MWKRIGARTTSGLVVFLLASSVIITLLTEVRANSLRPTDCGAETKQPDFQICEPPPCTEDQINTLWPTSDRNFFYQCAPKSRCSWYPVKMPCAPGTVFGFKEQVCIWECDWVDPCNGTVPTTTTTATPSTTASLSTSSVTAETTETTQETSTKEEETTPTEEPSICLIPSCTDDEVHKLWPVPGRPESFYQCEPNSKTKCEWIVVQKLCNDSLYFDFKKQECVDPEDWEDVCTPEETTTESRTTETTAVTTENVSTTTEEASTTTDQPTESTSTVETTTERNIECPIPDCKQEPYNDLWAVTNQPESFYVCQPVNGSKCNFEPALKKCPDGQLFNGKKKECVEPKDWEESCSETTTTDSSETTTEPSVTTSTDVTSTQEPDFQLCDKPACIDSQLSTLWPHPDPIKYYQCQPVEGSGFEAEEMTCENNYYFNYNRQECVEQRDWENVCPSVTTTTEPGETTSTEISTTDGSTTEVSTTEIITTDQTTESTTEQESTTVSSTESTEPSSTEGSTTEDPGFPLCQIPPCTTEQRGKLWPSDDPTVFYRCIQRTETEWVAQALNCERALYFDFKKQVCVVPAEWENVCPETSNQYYCIQPECRTDSGKNKLYPHPDRQYFYQCAPSNNDCGFAPVKMPCAKGLAFSYQQQVCVETCDWMDPCDNSTTPTTSTARTTTVKMVNKPRPTTIKPRPVTTKKPPVTTKKPPVTTKKPQSTTKKPQVTTKKPQTTTSTRRTTTTSQQPSPSTVGPDTGTMCIPPKCDTDFERLRLYPHPDKHFYYQCAPDANRVPAYIATERPCGPGTAFSWRYQVCVHEADWEDPCENGQNEIPMEKRMRAGTPGPMYLPPRYY